MLTICEPGSLAAGKLDLMVEEIQMAARCGFSAYKTQWVSSPARLADRRQAHDYRQWYAGLAWPREHHEALRAECTKHGLHYFCSVYLPEDVEVVAPYVNAIKIASFEAVNGPLREAVRATGVPVIVSTGMLEQTDVDRVVDAYLPLRVDPGRLPRPPLTLLHCVSAYPAPMAALNLGVITQWWARYPGVAIGFSDHSANFLTGALAVAAGATVLEVHTRLPWADRSHPDYATALALPGDGIMYVTMAETALSARGDGVKRSHVVESRMGDYRVAYDTA